MTIDGAYKFIAAKNQDFANYAHTLWAVEEKSTSSVMGFIGLQRHEHFAPYPEIGWRLGSQFWGKGYATEGAKASLEYAWNVLQVPAVFAYTVAQNINSIRVMEKIGMHRDAQRDFNHSKLPLDHPLSRFVVYAVQWPDVLAD